MSFECADADAEEVSDVLFDALSCYVLPLDAHRSDATNSSTASHSTEARLQRLEADSQVQVQVQLQVQSVSVEPEQKRDVRELQQHNNLIGANTNNCNNDSNITSTSAFSYQSTSWLDLQTTRSWARAAVRLSLLVVVPVEEVEVMVGDKEGAQAAEALTCGRLPTYFKLTPAFADVEVAVQQAITDILDASYPGVRFQVRREEILLPSSRSASSLSASPSTSSSSSSSSSIETAGGGSIASGGTRSNGAECSDPTSATADPNINNNIINPNTFDWVRHVQESWPPQVIGDLTVYFPWHTTVPMLETTARSTTTTVTPPTAPPVDSAATATGTSPGQRYSLVLEGGAAFGTGDHPTTRLCCRWLQEAVVTATVGVVDTAYPHVSAGVDSSGDGSVGSGAGKNGGNALDAAAAGAVKATPPHVLSVLDYGCGSGILGLGKYILC